MLHEEKLIPVHARAKPYQTQLENTFGCEILHLKAEVCFSYFHIINTVDGILGDDGVIVDGGTIVHGIILIQPLMVYINVDDDDRSTRRHEQNTATKI